MAHHPTIHAKATGLAAEEAYVHAHQAAIDRTINSREFKLGTLSYVQTGHVPADKFWSNLAKQEAKDPAAFNLKHPSYAGFFTAPARLGELPTGNVIFDVMKVRDQSQHANFAAHHSFYVGLVDRDLALEQLGPVTTPGNPSGTTTTGGGTSGDGTGTTIGTGAGTSGSGGSGGSGGGVNPAAVPEPASWLMLALGLVAILAVRRVFRRGPSIRIGLNNPT